MEGLKRGDVVIATLRGVPGKNRPAVVLRSDLFAGHLLVTLAPLNSELHPDLPLLRLDLAPTAENGLHLASQVMVDALQSVLTTQVDRVIGRVTSAELEAIGRAVAVYLGLAD